MKRRTFLVQALLAPAASLAAAAAWLQSCGGGSDYATGMACSGRAPMVGVANAHTHPACVPMAALSAGGSYTMILESTPYAPHTHTFVVDVTTLNAGGAVSGLSSFDAANTHQHSVTF